LCPNPNSDVSEFVAVIAFTLYLCVVVNEDPCCGSLNRAWPEFQLELSFFALFVAVNLILACSSISYYTTMRFSLLAVASLVSVVASAEQQQQPSDPLVDVVGSRLLAAAAAVTADTNDDEHFLQHYGSPSEGCEKDERSFQINGIPDGECSTKCTDFLPCPTDVPDGVTATPMCALQDPSTGSQYCILVCSSKESETTGSMLRSTSSGGGGGAIVRDDQCGDAVCRPVQGQDGLGICTYDV